MKQSIARICSMEPLDSRTLLSLAAPDISFSGDGRQTYPFTDSQVTSASAFDVQRDEKIVLAGATFGSNRYSEILLARLKPDGTLDGSFGRGGKICTHHSLQRNPGPAPVRAPSLWGRGENAIRRSCARQCRWVPCYVHGKPARSPCHDEF